MDKESLFRVCGYVKRRWVADSGKFGTLTLEDCGEREPIINLVCFSSGPIAALRNLEPGQLVRVKGNISTAPIKDKKGEEIKIDGYKRYENLLAIQKMEVDPTSRKSSSENGGGSDDNLPAGW